MEASGKKGMTVSYCENSEAYIIYAHGKRIIEFSRDIKIDEDSGL